MGHDVVTVNPCVASTFCAELPGVGVGGGQSRVINQIAEEAEA